MAIQDFDSQEQLPQQIPQDLQQQEAPIDQPQQFGQEQLQQQSFTVSDSDRQLVESMKIEPEQTKMDLYIDSDGKTYDDIPDKLIEAYDKTELKDPPTEEEKQQKKQDIEQRKAQELELMTKTTIDEWGKKPNNGYNNRRLERDIKKKTADIEAKYKQEYDEYIKGKIKEEIKKPAITKKVGDVIAAVDNSILTNIENMNAIAKESLPSFQKFSMPAPQQIDPTFEQKYQEVVSSGIDTYEKFMESANNGTLPDGAVFRLTNSGGIISQFGFGNQSPFYIIANKKSDGTVEISKAGDALVSKEGKYMGLMVPVKPMSNIVVDVELANISGYKRRMQDVDGSDLPEEQKKQKRAKLTQDHIAAVEKNTRAYEKYMTDPNISRETKLALIASVYPAHFKKQYAAYLAEAGNEKGAQDKMLEVGWKILTSPFAVIGAASNVLEKGTSRIAAAAASTGFSMQDVQMGTLAIELERNPELIKYIDEVVKEAGPTAGQYLNSTFGLAQLVVAAKAKLMSKDVNAMLSQSKPVLEKMAVITKQFKVIADDYQISIADYNRGIETILGRTGYSATLREFKKAEAELSNSPDQNVRDMYRYFKIKQQWLNPDGTINEAGLASASEQDKAFAASISKRIFNGELRGVESSVIEKIGRLNELSKRGQELFPKAELEDYKNKNAQPLEQKGQLYTQAKEAFSKSPIFSEQYKWLFQGVETIENAYNNSDRDTFYNTFPTESFYAAGTNNALVFLNPVFRFGIGVTKGIADILGGVTETMDVITNAGGTFGRMSPEGRNLSYSLMEFQRRLQTELPEATGVSERVASGMGAALPMLVAFVGSFMAGGPAGGAAYLSAMMTGKQMREAANAGLGIEGQIVYALLTEGLEFGSEFVSPEINLVKGLKGKSTLTKELVEQIMNPKTRTQALKEYARSIWGKAVNTAKLGTLEQFEEEIANKGTAIIQSFYNSAMNTSFNPSAGTLQSSVDGLLTMIGTTMLFRGGASLMETKAPASSQIKTDAKLMMKASAEINPENPLTKGQAILMSALTTHKGLMDAIDIVNKVRSGEIAMTEVNMDVVEQLENWMIPVAMSQHTTFAAMPNATIQQRTVALENMIKLNQMQDMLENGQVHGGAAEAAIQTFRTHAETALADPAFAEKQFALTNDDMSNLIFDFFGLADNVAEKTANDIATARARRTATTPTSQVAETEIPTLDQQSFAREFKKVAAAFYEGDATQLAVGEAQIKENPIAFIGAEISQTRGVIELLKSQYDAVSGSTTAPNILENIDRHEAYLSQLLGLKDRFIKSSSGEVVNDQGQTMGQIERATKYRQQATDAATDVVNAVNEAGLNSFYAKTMQPGNEMLFMESAASQVVIDEPSAVKEFGQKGVDRIKQYIRDTNFKTPMTVVRTKEQVQQRQELDQQMKSLSEAIARVNSTARTQALSDVKALVDRLKKAFPGVKVVMDKKGFKEALKDDAARDMMTKGGVVYGRVLGGTIYLNPEFSNFNTPLHEFGHIWINVARESYPELYDKGLSLIRDSEYMARIQSDPLYQGLTQNEMEEEALATAIGDRGEQIVNEVRKQGFKKWMRRLIQKMAQYAGIFNLTKMELDHMNLNEFLNRVNASLLSGEPLTFNKLSERNQFMTRPEGLSIVNGWYSPIERRLLETKTEKQSANKWLGIVGSKDEAVYTGVKGWLEGKSPQEQVSKQEILDWMKDNRVEISEVVKSDQGMNVWQKLEKNTEIPKYDKYQLEGEKENYKEVLVTLPKRKIGERFVFDKYRDRNLILYISGLNISVSDNVVEDAANKLSDLTKEELLSKAKKESDFEGRYDETAEEKQRTKERYDDIVSQINSLAKKDIVEGVKFSSTHFDEPNILVHLRMNTRTDADGNKVLFLEEVQSDWGQKGKKEGFGENKPNDYNKLAEELKDSYDVTAADIKEDVLLVKQGMNAQRIRAKERLINYFGEERALQIIENQGQSKVPAAPFVTNTNAWTKLGLKMALREAVAQGADKIAWTTGEQQNDRYDLSKQVDEITYSKYPDGTYRFSGNKNDNQIFNYQRIPENKLEDYVGKEVANKIINGEGNVLSYGNKEEGTYGELGKTLSGVDLKVGGKGMKGFYDKIVPDVAKALVKELTGKQGDVGETKIGLQPREDASITEDEVQSFKDAGWDVKEEGDGFYSATRLLKGGKTTTQQSIDVTPELSASVSEGMPMFMARQADITPVIKEAAKKQVKHYVDNGYTIEDAVIMATREVSISVIKQITGNFDTDKLAADIQSAVNEEAEIQRGLKREAERQEKLNRAFASPETQEVVNAANRIASDIVTRNTGTKNKMTSKEAFQEVLDGVRKKIDDMYASGNGPAGVSWIQMRELASSIAYDATAANFSQFGRTTSKDAATVTLPVSQVVRAAIAQQIRAIKEVQDRTGAVMGAVNDALTNLSKEYGQSIGLSKGNIAKILNVVKQTVFSTDVTDIAIQDIEDAVMRVVENGLRKGIISDTKARVGALEGKRSRAAYTAPSILSVVNDVIDTDLDVIANGNTDLLTLSEFNSALSRLIKGDLSAAMDVGRLLQILKRTPPEVSAVDEGKSLLNKIKRVIKDVQDVPDLSLMNLGQLQSIQAAVKNIEERKSNINLLSPKEQADILQQYGILQLTQAADIDAIVKDKEGEIVRSAMSTINRIKAKILDESSDIRTKIKNKFSYERFIGLMNALTDDYLSTLSPKQLLDLSSSLEEVEFYGNDSHGLYKHKIDAMRHAMKTKMHDWGTNISARRNKIGAPGLVGTIMKGMKDFYRTFTDVEGATPSAERIAANITMLRLHAMDANLYNGFDELNMGFLEANVFAPMSKAIDGAHVKASAQLGDIQSSLIHFSNKEDRAMINNAIGAFWKKYNMGGSLFFKTLLPIIKKGKANAVYVDLSVRMATIVAHQIDHISNLKEGEIRRDVTLVRNILGITAAEMAAVREDPSKAPILERTMAEFFGQNGADTLSQNDIMDAIAYAALTNNGETTLKELGVQELEALLSENQRNGLESWRQHIERNYELFESAQTITGSMNSARINYFPRRVYGQQGVGGIQDTDTYMQAHADSVGFDRTQLKGRTAEVGKMDLNGTRVLYDNLSSLYLLHEVKPYLDYIKGVEDAVEMERANDDVNHFAVAYMDGISMAVKKMLQEHLVNIEIERKALHKTIVATQSFAANVWLKSNVRQLRDFFGNFQKVAATLAFEMKTLNTEVFRAFLPQSGIQKKFYTIDSRGRKILQMSKHTRKWEEYAQIAAITGSTVYRTASVYADNILEDYKKSPEQLQREQRVMSWQDMVFKKLMWMKQFENAFERLTGRPFDHEAFKDERGVYRASVMEFVERASMSADAVVDRAVGLPSLVRQPLRRQPFIPLITRGLRNMFGGKRSMLSIGRSSNLGVITGFLQGYLTVQNQSFSSYMRLAFSSRSGLSVAKRTEYLTRGILENVVPTIIYSMTGLAASVLFTTVGSAAFAMAGTDDPEERRRMAKEMLNKNFWDKQMAKMKAKWDGTKLEVEETLINALQSVVIDPQTSMVFRTSGGFALFYFMKQRAVEKMATMNKSERKRAKEEIRRMERFWLSALGIKPIDIISSDLYKEVFVGVYGTDRIMEGTETMLGLLGGYKAISDVLTTAGKTIEVMAAPPEANADKDVAIASAILQAYGLIFTTMAFAGKLSPFISGIAGDSYKFAKAAIMDESTKLEDYKYKHSPVKIRAQFEADKKDSGGRRIGRKQAKRNLGRLIGR